MASPGKADEGPSRAGGRSWWGHPSTNLREGCQGCRGAGGRPVGGGAGHRGRGEALRLKGRGSWMVEVRVGVRPSGAQLHRLADRSHIGTARGCHI